MLWAPQNDRACHPGGEKGGQGGSRNKDDDRELTRMSSPSWPFPFRWVEGGGEGERGLGQGRGDLVQCEFNKTGSQSLPSPLTPALPTSRAFTTRRARLRACCIALGGALFWGLPLLDSQARSLKHDTITFRIRYGPLD